MSLRVLRGEKIFSLTKNFFCNPRRRDEELAKGYGQFVHTLPIVTEGGPQ